MIFWNAILIVCYVLWSLVIVRLIYCFVKNRREQIVSSLKYLMNVTAALVVVFLLKMQVALIDRLPEKGYEDLWCWFLNISKGVFRISIVLFLILIVINYCNYSAAILA